MTSKIVISHATSDKPLVEAFVDFLRLGLDINQKDIYCTSIIGTIPTGQNFVDNIKNNIEGTQLVILLLTENYFKSKFCLAEMGAVWMVNKNIYPIIISPLSYEALEGTPLAGVQSKRIQHSGDLIAIADEFYKLKIADDAPIGTLVSKEAGKFFDNFEGIKAKIKTEENSVVSQEEHDKIAKDNKRLLDLIDGKAEEIERLEEYIEQIKQAKDKDEINQIEMNNTPVWEQFETHIQDVKLSIRKLDRIVQSALFYDVRGEEYYPSYQIYKEDIRNLSSRERIFEDYSDDGIKVNEEYPEIGDALKKIEELKTFIIYNRDVLEETFVSHYSIPLSFKSADFWERLLGVNIIFSER